MDRRTFGQLPDGRDILLFTLANAHGLTAHISTYGGTLVSLLVPDARGHTADVVLGFDECAPYLGDHPKFGTLIGRYGNRIGHGTFTLDGVPYQLALTDPPHHLHGGVEGFDRKLWEATDVSDHEGDGLQLRYLSPDGEEGYPGNLDVTATFRLTDDNALRINYHATTDQPTIINLTHHGYFNLAGQGDIRTHELQLSATHYTPVDETGLPTGEIAPVSGTAMDFLEAKPLAQGLDSEDPQVKLRHGYDHNFVLNHGDQPLSEVIARVYEPESGRIMEVLTTQPGVQLYTANFLADTPGKGGQVYQPYGAICLETQDFPDAPNLPSAPSPILRPGEIYEHAVVYRFRTA